jgi:endoglucanase
VGHFSALIFAEEDAVDTAGCLSPQGLRDRESEMRYELGQLSKLPHALVYVEGATSDANRPRFVARVLNAAGARRIRGFFLNDTHFNWASNEIAYGNKVSRMTHGLHFVVDTRADGNGPLKTKHPVQQGNEVLCNPPGRGLGPPPGSTDGKYSPQLDGFVWATIPGESTAKHCRGRSDTFAASGIFDPNIAIDLARNANNRVGPGYPSQPY